MFTTDKTGNRRHRRLHLVRKDGLCQDFCGGFLPPSFFPTVVRASADPALIFFNSGLDHAALVFLSATNILRNIETASVANQRASTTLA